MDERPGWGGKVLVIRGGGLCIQILATAVDRTGRLVSEGSDKCGSYKLHLTSVS